jgi:hypothetical protein
VVQACHVCSFTRSAIGRSPPSDGRASAVVACGGPSSTPPVWLQMVTGGSALDGSATAAIDAAGWLGVLVVGLDVVVQHQVRAARASLECVGHRPPASVSWSQSLEFALTHCTTRASASKMASAPHQMHMGSLFRLAYRRPGYSGGVAGPSGDQVAQRGGFEPPPLSGLRHPVSARPNLCAWLARLEAGTLAEP